MTQLNNVRDENKISVALEQKLMLGVIVAMLGALLAGCSADKAPSREETTLTNAAKDVVIPLEAGKMKNPLPRVMRSSARASKCFLSLAPSATVRMGVHKLTSGATWTRRPWTCTHPTCSTGVTGNYFGSYGTEFALQACLPGSRAFPITTPGSLHVSSTTFPASTRPLPPQQSVTGTSRRFRAGQVRS